jgi:hypothetical protein
LAGLETQKVLYDSSLRTLSDASTTTLILVSRPERSALAEAERSRAELAEMGVANQRLYLNGIFVAKDRADRAACALEARGREALAAMPAGLATLPRNEVPLLPYAPMGVENLQSVFDGTHPQQQPHVQLQALLSSSSLSALIDDLERSGRGVVMTMGKGGVGKTTIASAIAMELQGDLARAGIAPFAWVVNQSFAGAVFRDPLLRERGVREQPFLAEVRDGFSRRLVVVPWVPFEPAGPDRLRQFVDEAGAAPSFELARG